MLEKNKPLCYNIIVDRLTVEKAVKRKNIKLNRGYGSVGRAPRSQRGGHEFESRYLHQRQAKSGLILPALYIAKLLKNFC